VPLPGLGFELECRGISLRNEGDLAKQASDDERERVRGKEILVDSSLTGGVKFPKDWTLTAELVGAVGVELLCPEIVIHGPDAQGRTGTGQGVKLTPGNVDVTAAIGADVVEFVGQWAKKPDPVAIRGFDNYGTWAIGQLAEAMVRYKTWGLQVTAPVPLAALYAMLPVTDDEDNLIQLLHPLISDIKRRALVRVTAEELTPRPPAGPDTDAFLAFLSLVISYIKAGPLDTNARGLKHVIPIMPRTDFSALYQSCAKVLSSPLTDTVRSVCTGRGIEFDKAQLYWKNAGEVVALDAVQWITQLPTKDLVAEYDKLYRHGQIGGLGSTMEQLIGDPNASVPIFEFRDISGVFTEKLTGFLTKIEAAIRGIHAKAAK
jgi:hypothetical protein